MEKDIENRFLSGLFWGLLIGGGLAVFLNSQSGRKLLKFLSQEGLENILHLLDEDKDLEEDYDYEEEQDEAFQKAKDLKPQPRRFFRGIGKKRLN